MPQCPDDDEETGLSLSEVFRQQRETHRRVIDVIERAPELDLRGKPLSPPPALDTYSHYRSTLSNTTLDRRGPRFLSGLDLRDDTAMTAIEALARGRTAFEQEACPRPTRGRTC